MAFGIHLPELPLRVSPSQAPDGAAALTVFLDFATAAIDQFTALQEREVDRRPLAAVGRLRGRGPRASFGAMAPLVERDMPRRLEYPFEGSDRVGGAVWLDERPTRGRQPASLAKLRWESRAIDLPMHVHDHSDRVIVVLEGRGFFHVSPTSADSFTGADVATVAARERDVFLFTRGTVHTFSTRESPMTLLSCQLPFLPFDDPLQYRLPSARWTAERLYLDDSPSPLVCEPSWCVIAASATASDRSAALRPTT